MKRNIKTLFKIILIFVSIIIILYVSNTEKHISNCFKDYLENQNIFQDVNTVVLETLSNDQKSKENLLSASTGSKSVTEVPWSESEAFLIHQKKNNTNILMAAYKTVLRDPLPGEEDNVHLAASMLSGRVVKPGTIFSQNSSIGPYVESRGFKKGPTYLGSQLGTTVGGGVCKIASTLYNVSVLCNLDIVERFAHSMPVPYVPYGQDATVAYGSRDFKFKNNTNFPILIWAEGIGNTLFIAFYGAEKPPIVEWEHQIIKIYKAHKLYKLNPSIGFGEERLMIEGMNGAFLKSRVNIKYQDGTCIKKSLNSSYYSPFPFIYEKGI